MTVPAIQAEVGIYRILCIGNGRIYIGSSSGLRGRLANHLSSLRRGIHGNQHLQRAWNKYGEGSFAIEIVEYCSLEDQVKREQHYIDAFNVCNPSVGFNMSPTAGSCQGVPCSEEKKEKLRQKRKGTKMSDEWYRNVRAAVLRNRKQIQQTSIEKRGIEFDIISPTGKMLHVKGLKQFAKEQGIDRSTLSKVVRKVPGYYTAGGWHLQNYVVPGPYQLIRPSGQIESVPHDKLNEFCRANEVDPKRIREVVRGYRGTYKGWTTPQTT